MEISYKTIGANIRAARKAAGLTQEHAAERIGISLLHYGRLERGERNVSLTHLTMIADAFGVSFFSLLAGSVLGDTIDNHILARYSGCSPDALLMMDELCAVVAGHDR